MIGVGLPAGVSVSRHRLTQQVPREMLRIRAGEFRRALKECPVAVQLLQRYALVLIERGAQNAACNQHHTVEERMSRWLLETADRAGRGEFKITQEFLAEMLGVRRQTVNLTARLLQQAGLIAYRRGRVTILDRAALEQASCECYRLMGEAYEQLMRLPVKS
jgi:CRP-like cAMP-binding protein